MRGAAGTGGRKTSQVSKTNRLTFRTQKRSDFLFLVIFSANAKKVGLPPLFFFLNFAKFYLVRFEREFF
jgi:hypothetical protein